ncbi:polysaccharide ABC transporter ATP-binding protein [Aurantibacter sp.]|uniref:ABC transporter ATP-binding protein n=1 Tax=Aurantibacter sp. TaxID=2807103 RepID=UPI0035C86B1D
MEDQNVLIKVEGLSKKFCKDLKTSLWYGVKDLFSGITGNRKERVLRPKEFWAVKDINFELKRGECLGLIGHNGAGKSTLLKILNGLINPDEGKITIKGRVGALIELGAGFNPILSGRENVYNNGAILGFTRKEIDDKLEKIIEFSELEEFIDMPIQNYSSGMKVRLGFAVAAQMEPDVLIIDEVLAVGDLGFILKCYKTIDTILPNTAVIFVSHSMPMVSRICNKIILLDKGKAKFQGKDVSSAIDLYYSRFATNDQNIVFTDNSLKINEVKVVTSLKDENGLPQLNRGEDLNIFLKIKLLENIEIPLFSIFIYDKEQRPVAMLERNKEEDLFIGDDKYITFTVTHKEIQLSKGVYSINLSIVSRKRKEPIIRSNSMASFQVIDKEQIWPSFLLKANYK